MNHGALLLAFALSALGMFAPYVAAQATKSPPAASIQQNGNAAPGAAAEEPEHDSYALLVGCTTYDHLPQGRQLKGPANDVSLLRQVLIDRFRFPADHIATLVEGGPTQTRPVRKNIEREFQRLAAHLRPRDRVVILLAGHGSRQPNDAEDKDDLEPDGLDEVFCPADVECLAEDGRRRIRNAIVDDELKIWLDRIVARGAFVWFIADSCHSGTVSRDSAVRRGFDADELLGPGTATVIQPTAPVTRGGAEESLGIEVPLPGKGSLVALYAAQPNQETYEAMFGGARYGLLTYSVCHALMECDQPLSYRELQQRIYRKYRERTEYPPTPLLEGQGTSDGRDTRDLEVLGTKVFARRSQISLRAAGIGQYQLNAGSLHGISTGSVLAVYPAVRTASAQDKIGHVRVTQVSPLAATVEPCAFGDTPMKADFPAENRADVVFVAHELQRLRISVDPLSETGARLSAPSLDNLRNRLLPLNDAKDSPLVVVDDERQADWLLHRRGPHLWLTPRSHAGQRLAGAVPVFGPVPETSDDRLRQWLLIRLARISRASNLMRLASSSGEGHRVSQDVQVEVEMLRYADRSDAQPKPVRWQRDGIKLTSGEIIGFRLTNSGRLAVDVCLLFIDSGFGISQFFPEPGAAGNRLQPGETLDTNPGEVQADTLGAENLILAAIPAKALQAPLDLAFLEQPNCLQDQRTPSEIEPPATRSDSPLGRFLLECRNNVEGQRGIGRPSTDAYQLRIFTWETLPKTK